MKGKGSDFFRLPLNSPYRFNFDFFLNKEVPEKKRLINLGKGSLSSYNKGIKSLFDMDGELAEDSIRESKETDKASEELMKKELPEKTSFKVKTIIRSMDRTRKLTRDIAEIVINLIAGESI